MEREEFISSFIGISAALYGIFIVILLMKLEFLGQSSVIDQTILSICVMLVIPFSYGCRYFYGKVYDWGNKND